MRLNKKKIYLVLMFVAAMVILIPMSIYLQDTVVIACTLLMLLILGMSIISAYTDYIVVEDTRLMLYEDTKLKQSINYIDISSIDYKDTSDTRYLYFFTPKSDIPFFTLYCQEYSCENLRLIVEKIRGINPNVRLTEMAANYISNL